MHKNRPVGLYNASALAQLDSLLDPPLFFQWVLPMFNGVEWGVSVRVAVASGDFVELFRIEGALTDDL